MRQLIKAFRDPNTRPRAIAWAGAAFFALVALTVAALGVTSTRWFCSEGCHKVQDDTILAYQASPHSEISCMACHMPVGSGPVKFVLHKAKALGELYLTVTGTYHLPLNDGSHLALDEHEMGSGQCTQCHGSNRKVTPSKGILIDHAAHAEKHIWCTVCHNRVAHVENFELTLTDPKSGEPNRKHEDFMKMRACFRCHTQTPGELKEDGKAAKEGDAKEGLVPQEAPGECSACHPAGFELRPASHFEAGFYTRSGDSAGHAQGAKQDKAYCAMCHNEERFCDACHKVPMPHPDGFTDDHGESGTAQPGVCANCHNKSGRPTADTEFCNACHHEGSDPTKPWVPQHFVSVRDKGAGACFDCHAPTFCARCHVRSIVR